MLVMAFLFGVETDAAGDVRHVHVSVIQRGGSQLAHTGVRAGREGVILARETVEHPDHPQALGEGAVVDGVGQPFEARDFGFCDLAGVGQGCDEAAFDAGFNAASRFYDSAETLLGMKPAQYRDGGWNVTDDFFAGVAGAPLPSAGG